MSGKTHAMIGANMVWLSAVLGFLDERIIYLVPVGAVAALLPDLDAADAKIHYVGGGILGAFHGAFAHRSFLHSLLAMALVAVLSVLALGRYHPMLPVVVTLAYASHPILDGLNRPGVRFLFPIRRRYRLLPRSIATTVKGTLDNALFMFGALALAGFLLTQYLPMVQESTLQLMTGMY